MSDRKAPLFADNWYRELPGDEVRKEVQNLYEQFGQLRGEDILLESIGDPSNSSVQTMQDIFHSSGRGTGGRVTVSATPNHVDVAAGEGWIRPENDPTATLVAFAWGARTLEIPSGTVRYIGIEYNDGDPLLVVRSTNSFNGQDEFYTATAVNDGVEIHIIQNGAYVGDHAGNMIRRLLATNYIARDSFNGGLELSESGTRNINVTAGTLWSGLESFDLAAIDTGAGDSITTYYYNGTSWVATNSITQWPNAQYNDTTSGLVALNNNWYSNLYFYIATEGEVFCVYGQAQYASVAGAEEEDPPGFLPDPVTYHTILIGKIVFQKNAATAETIVSYLGGSPTGGSASSNHGNLSGLGDDDHPQYILADATRAFTATPNVNGTNVSLVGHTHVAANITDLASYTGFDARYYTESEVDTLLTGKSDVGHTHAATDVVSGTFADARISQTSVTQHQAALSVTESQISDLQAYLLASDIDTLAELNLILTDATLVDASHTHTESDITDLQNYALVGHTHTLADVTDSGTSAALDVPAVGDATAGQVVKGDDSRLTDARAPTAHTHTESEITDLQNYTLVGHTHTLSDVTDSGTAAALNVPALGDAAVGEVVKGDDSRLTDARAPTAHTHVEADITDLGNYTLVGHTHTEADITDLQAYLLNITGEPFGDLSDVTITGITSGEIVKWSGTAWVNNTLVEAGIAAVGHTHTESDITDLQSYSLVGHVHAASDVTSGTFADARISETSVTQHQAALTITASQVSDFDENSSMILSGEGVPSNLIGNTQDLYIDVQNGTYHIKGAGYDAGMVWDNQTWDADTWSQALPLAGEGVPIGGSAGQALVKVDATDFNTTWANVADAVHTHTLSDVTDSGTSAALDVPATGDAAVGEVVKGDDTRLTDSRTPTAHTHTETDITDLDKYDQSVVDSKIALAEGNALAFAIALG